MDIAAGRELRRFQDHHNSVHCVCVSSDGRLALSGGVDRDVRLWELATGRLLNRLRGHTDTVWGVSFSPRGGLALSCGEDRKIRMWIVATGCESKRLSGHTNWVMSVTFTPDGRSAVSRALDGTLRLWDLTTGKTVRCFEVGAGCNNERPSIIACSPKGQKVLYADHSGSAQVLDLASGEVHCLLGNHVLPLTGLAVSPDGRYAAAGSLNGTISLWEL